MQCVWARMLGPDGAASTLCCDEGDEAVPPMPSEDWGLSFPPGPLLATWPWPSHLPSLGSGPASWGKEDWVEGPLQFRCSSLGPKDEKKGGSLSVPCGCRTPAGVISDF